MDADFPAALLTWTRYLALVMAMGLLAATTACGDSATPGTSSIGVYPATVPVPTFSPASAATESPATVDPSQIPVVRVDELAFPVELAVTPQERIKGLSGRSFLDSGTGMLFVFEVESRFRFWMREMEIPLDMVWIGAGCRVVDISENVPPPDPSTPLDDLPRYSPSGSALYVLEINGGEAAALGLGAGDTVRFVGSITGKYRC